MELGVGASERVVATRRFLRDKSRFVWLTPPTPNGTLTVLDLLGASNSEEHRKAVAAWAADVWPAWTPHHAYTERLAKASLPLPGAQR